MVGAGSDFQALGEELIYSSTRHHWNPLSALITTHILLKGDEVDQGIIGLAHWRWPSCGGSRTPQDVDGL